MRGFPAFHAIIAAVTGSMVLVNAGCEQGDRGASAPPPPPAPQEAAAPGPTDGMVAVPDEQHDPQLVAAIRRARDTADTARQRWLETPQTQRDRWAVKWRAPTAAGGFEHVWVRPVRWSRFRIEGVLASAPRGELESARVLGELVSFPIEELSDWMYAAADGSTQEGGFTLEVLEERYGEPR